MAGGVCCLLSRRRSCAIIQYARIETGVSYAAGSGGVLGSRFEHWICSCRPAQRQPGHAVHYGVEMYAGYCPTMSIPDQGMFVHHLDNLNGTDGSA
jgi:hypothetical protein